MVESSIALLGIVLVGAAIFGLLLLARNAGARASGALVKATIVVPCAQQSIYRSKFGAIFLVSV